MRRILLVLVAAAIVAIAIGWFVAGRIPRWVGATRTADAVPEAQRAAEPVRKIRANLFYVSEDGTALVSVPREVPFAEGTAAQARRIVEEQLKPAPSPYAQALPAATTVRAVFITERHEAFVDFGPEITTGHTGGSLDELFSIYAIVNALTVNLPAIERVQILVDGKEVDSLAGHVDLRRPLPRNLTWVSQSGAPAPEDATTTPAAPSEPGPSAARASGPLTSRRARAD